MRYREIAALGDGVSPMPLSAVTGDNRPPPTSYGRPVVNDEQTDEERAAFIRRMYGPDRDADDRAARKEKAEIEAKRAHAALDRAKAAEIMARLDDQS